MLTEPEPTWRPVVGYEGRYEVSDDGRVRLSPEWSGRSTLRPGEELAQPTNKTGTYRWVNLYDPKTQKNSPLPVHRVVAEAWCHKREGATDVNHIDNCGSNNWAANLEWVTKSENMDHMWRTQPRPENRGKLTWDQVHEMRRLHAAGMSRDELGVRYGMHPGNIWYVVTGRTWKEKYR